MQEEPFSARPLAPLAKMLKRIYLISEMRTMMRFHSTLIEEALIHWLKQWLPTEALMSTTLPGILFWAAWEFPNVNVYSYLTISRLQTVSQSQRQVAFCFELWCFVPEINNCFGKSFSFFQLKILQNIHVSLKVSKSYIIIIRMLRMYIMHTESVKISATIALKDYFVFH